MNNPRRKFFLPAIVLVTAAALIIIVLLVIRSLTPAQLALPGDLAVFLTDIQGKVQIQKNSQDDFTPASNGDRMHVGDRLRTSADSLVRLDMSNGTIAQTGQRTILTLQRLAIQDGSPFSLLDMESGELWAIIKNGWMQVDTPLGTAVVSDSYLHVRIDDSTGEVVFTCLAGGCRVSNALGSIDLKGGQTALISAAGAPPVFHSDFIASNELLTATAIDLSTSTPTPFVYTPTPSPSLPPEPSPSPLFTSTSSLPTRTPTECPVPEGWLPYTVQAGDTLYDIALAYNTTIAELKTGNCLTSSVIYVDQVLYVPSLDPTGTTTLTETATATGSQTITTTITATATNTPTITHTATITRTGTTTNTPTTTATPTKTSTSTTTRTTTATSTNTPTPTATRPSDSALIVNVSGGDSDCYEVDFDITVENTGERSDATDVVVMITVVKGGEYVETISQNSLNFGDIAPGASETQTVTVDMSVSWLSAPAGTEVRLEAVVVQETSRPEHNVGKRDIGTTTHPGICTLPLSLKMPKFSIRHIASQQN